MSDKYTETSVETTEHKKGRPMNVFVAKGSRAETRFRKSAGLPIDPRSLAPGFTATPGHDLINHGGKTIHDLNFANFYIGGADSWNKDEVKSIDNSLASAMSDRPLNNVMAQYFLDDNITSVFKVSQILPGNPPSDFFQNDVEKLVTDLLSQGKLDQSNLQNTVHNFMLPKDTILHSGDSNGGGTLRSNAATGFPEAEEEDSTNGLGGYHGSVLVAKGSSQATLYYAVGVYSEGSNGIPVFDQSWKNVVATFYHELNEARTDPDIEDVIKAGDSPQMLKHLGWTSKQGEECGDFPVLEASPLTKVFMEVPLAAGNTKVPVQLQYSNAAHGPEGPIAQPHPRHARRR